MAGFADRISQTVRTETKMMHREGITGTQGTVGTNTRGKLRQAAQGRRE